MNAWNVVQKRKISHNNHLFRLLNNTKTHILPLDDGAATGLAGHDPVGHAARYSGEPQVPATPACAVPATRETGGPPSVTSSAAAKPATASSPPPAWTRSTAQARADNAGIGYGSPSAPRRLEPRQPHHSPQHTDAGRLTARRAAAGRRDGGSCRLVLPVGIKGLAHRQHLFWVGDVFAEEGALHAETVSRRLEDGESSHAHATPFAGIFDSHMRAVTENSLHCGSHRCAQTMSTPCTCI